MRYDFCTTIRDEYLNLETIYDFECEVDVDVSRSGDYFDVGAVYRDGVSLDRGDTLSQWIARRVREAAEDEIREGGRLLQNIMEKEGLYYRGLGGNDPDGRLVRVA